MLADPIAALFDLPAHNPSFQTVLTGSGRADDVLDFCVPVNTYFPPPGLRDSIAEHLDSLLKYYPDHGEANRKNLADLISVPSENLVVGNGSTEIITVLCRQVCGGLITPIPTFGQWTDLPPQFGKPVQYIMQHAERGFVLSVNSIVDQVRSSGARTFVLCNPNNPTGAVLSGTEIERLVDELKDLDRIVIDESFIDFADAPSAVSLAVKSHNLVVVKSLGKSLGWHGIRLGYAVANKALAGCIRGELPGWNINGVAAFVLANLHRHVPAYRDSLRKTQRDRDDMYARLGELTGISVFPSAANFLLIELPASVDGALVRDRLLADFGLFVRECSNKLGSSARYFRLAVRPRADVVRLMHAMHEILSPRKVVKSHG